MDGLGRAIAADVPVKLAGTTYLLRPMKLKDFGTVEQYLLSQVGTPVDQVAAEIPKLAAFPELQSYLYQLAEWDIKRSRKARQIAGGDVFDWINTPEGIVFTAWLCLGERYPTMFGSLEQTDTFFAAAGDEAFWTFQRQRDRASGIDLAAQLDWPDRAEDGKKGSVSWRKHIRKIAEALFWPPAAIANLTLYQLQIYMNDEEALGGTVTTSSLAHALALAESRRVMNGEM